MADEFDDDEDREREPHSPSPRPSPQKGTGGKVVRLPSKLNSGAIRPRHDGFTPAKQRKFFEALRETGCIRDACRVAGISKTTVDRWRDKDEVFDDKVEAMLALASVSLDTIAWKRATEGAEEKIYRNGRLVFTRVKPSDSILRLLMQGADPERYGRTGRQPSKHLLKKLKKQAEREVRAADSEEARATLEGKLVELLGMLAERQTRRKLSEGYTPGPDGKLVVPPGWRMVPAVPLLPPPSAPRRPGRGG